MTEMNMEFDLLNENIEDAPEVPDFVTPPSGFYKLTIQDVKMEKVEDSPMQFVKVLYVIDEVVELAKADAEAPAVGSLFSESFFTVGKDGKRSDIGIGNMKKAFQCVATTYGVSSWADIFERAIGAKISSKVVTKAGKKKTADGNVMYFTNTSGNEML